MLSSLTAVLPRLAIWIVKEVRGREKRKWSEDKGWEN